MKNYLAVVGNSHRQQEQAQVSPVPASHRSVVLNRDMTRSDGSRLLDDIGIKLRRAGELISEGIFDIERTNGVGIDGLPCQR